MTFRREPTVYLQTIAALLGVLVTFGFDWLSAEHAGLIVAALTAIIGAVNAAMVRPIAPAAFTGAVAALATLLAAYGLDFTQERIGAVQVLVLAVLTLLTRTQVSPKADPVPTAPAEGSIS